MLEKYHPESVRVDSEHQYEAGPYNADARRELYVFANPPYDIWDDGIKALYPLKGDETVLDIGTGNGIFLDILHNKYKHGGQMLGIDKFPQNFFKIHQEIISKNPIGPISFQPGEAERIHFKDESFDVVISGFANYHIPSPDKALNEFRRVLKTGGKGLITTRGVNNMERLWRLGGLVADNVGSERPRQPYSHWSITEAENTLPLLFSNVLYQHIQDTMLEIPMDVYESGDRLGWHKFSDALLSLRDNMYIDPEAGVKPSETDVREVIDTTIWRIFSDEIKTHGYFRMPVQQGVWVVQK